ncbi:MAG: flagellar export chaperone FliS [Pirellulaceae bacterium]
MHNARQAYLETQLLTATPQKLRLMLIEGAIRFANQTLMHWEEDRNDAAFESLLRCRGVVTELMAAIRPDGSEVSRRVVALYVFLFQMLTEGQIQRDRDKVAEVVRILEVERETWQQVCEQMPEAPIPADDDRYAPKEITASNTPAISPITSSGGASASVGGFSLDA